MRTRATIAATVAAAGLTGSALGGVTADLPVDNEDLVVGSFPGFDSSQTFPDPDGFVVTLVDARVPPVIGPPASPGVPWFAPMYNNVGGVGGPPHEWRARELGMIFGVELDDAPDPNIYAASTSNLYGNWMAYPYPQGGIGFDGVAAIYQIDGTTGNINSWVITAPTFSGGPGTNEMPSSGPGVGQICFDEARQQFFATNFEDGLIYRIDMSGTIIDTYDPFAFIPPTPGQFMRLGERVFAVEVYQDRLYFSVWLRDQGRPSFAWNPAAGTPPPNPNNSIWSIDIDLGTGALLGPEQLEIVVPYLHPTQQTYSNPVADIAFSENGEMMLAERSMPGDYGQIDMGHEARLLEYELVASVWTPSGQDWYLGQPIGGITGLPENATGGTTYDCDGNTWSGADQMGAAGYGIQRIDAGGNTIATRITNSYLVPWPANFKAGVGDVDAFRDCEATGPCDVECDPDALPEGEPCGSDINHGCDRDPHIYSGARCGDTICGNAWADNQQRDTDWYQFDVPDDDGDGLVEIHAHLLSEFPGVVRIHDLSCAELAIDESINCAPGEAIACVPAPGVYFISVKPETIGGGPILSGYPCGTFNEYELRIECVNCEGEPSGPCVTPPPGMIAWWTMDEPVGPIANEVVYGNDGSYSDNPTPVPGMVGNALAFDGIDDFVETNDDPNLDVGTSDFTLDAWIFYNGAASGIAPIIDKRDQGFGYYFLVHNGNIALEMRDGSSGVIHTGATVPVGVWTHVAVTVDRDDPNGIVFYLDGGFAGFADPTADPGTLDNPAGVHIGANHFHNVPPDGQSYFWGMIDEVEIFRRELDASEIAGLFFAGPSGKCKHCCSVPSWKALCNGADSVVVKIVVCNKSGEEHTYDVSIAGLPAGSCGNVDGPTIFNFIDPPMVTVAPGDCETVRVEIVRPSDMVNNGDVGCYEVTVENLDNGQMTTCTGKIVDRRLWCAVATPNDDVAIAKVNQTIVRGFAIQNIARPVPIIRFDIIPIDPHTGEPSPTISLDGLPPGEPIVRTVKIPPGEEGLVEFTIGALDHEPFVFYDIILMADFDGDDIGESPLAVIPARTEPADPCPGDGSGDGVVDTGDLLGMLGAWGTDDPTWDIAPPGGNGVVDVQDLLALVGAWGPCP